MFNHVNVGELPTVTTETIDRKRFYVTPEGSKYPSVTTVLGVRKNKELFEWRKKVGEEVAGYIARTAAQKGTKVHHMCEDFLNNMHIDFPDKWEAHKKNFFPWCLFTQLKSELLNNIDNIHFQEAGLYSDKYGIAGRVDCIAEYKGKLSIIDFKTSTKSRNDDWNYNYYVQASAYAEMYEERMGFPIDQIVILVVTDDGTVQEFVKEKEQIYLDTLKETLDIFHQRML